MSLTPSCHTHTHTFSVMPVVLLMLACVSPSRALHIWSTFSIWGLFVFAFLETLHLGKSLLIAGMLKLGPVSCRPVSQPSLPLACSSRHPPDTAEPLHSPQLQQLFLCIQREEINHPWSTQLRTQHLAEAQETGPGAKEWGHISAPHSLGPTEPTSLPRPLPPPQALEKLQFLYLADNLLDAIPRPLPLSLRSLHLQVSGFPRTGLLDGTEGGGQTAGSPLQQWWGSVTESSASRVGTFHSDRCLPPPSHSFPFLPFKTLPLHVLTHLTQCSLLLPSPRPPLSPPAPRAPAFWPPSLFVAPAFWASVCPAAEGR